MATGGTAMVTGIGARRGRPAAVMARTATVVAVGSVGTVGTVGAVGAVGAVTVTAPGGVGLVPVNDTVLCSASEPST